jgi:hypothetical protein
MEKLAQFPFRLLYWSKLSFFSDLLFVFELVFKGFSFDIIFFFISIGDIKLLIIHSSDYRPLSNLTDLSKKSTDHRQSAKTMLLVQELFYGNNHNLDGLVNLRLQIFTAITFCWGKKSLACTARAQDLAWACSVFFCLPSSSCGQSAVRSWDPWNKRNPFMPPKGHSYMTSIS